MTTFNVSPSVTVTEVDLTAVVPATAVAPGAIAGVFRWGPVLERTLISSEDQLSSVFGKPSDLNAETFFTAADYLAYSNSLYVVRANNGANTAESDTFIAKYPGALGNSIGVAYTDTEGYSTSITNQGTGAISVNDTTFTVVSEGNEFLSANAGSPSVSYELAEHDILRVGSDAVGYQNLVVDTISVAVSVEANTNIYTYTIGFKNRYSLIEDDFSQLTLTRIWGFSSVAEIAPSANSIHLVVYDVDGGISGTARSVLEVFADVSLVDGTTWNDGTNNFVQYVLENGSAYVDLQTSVVTGGVAAMDVDSRVYEELTGGTDGSSEANVAIGALAAGYDLYKEAADLDISFVITGKSVSATLPNYLVSNISEYRKDCLVVFSPTYSSVVGVSNINTQLANVLAFRAAIQNSSYWAMDSGYKYRYDKYNDKYRWVPLNGDFAGLMSRIEDWESPAGYKRGLIKNVVKLAFNPNKTMRDQLYGADVNPIITQAGQGTLLFGDKTGLGIVSSAFSRINVRRLFMAVEKTIATVSQSFLFELNDEFTQTQFLNLVDPYLRDIQGRRGIYDYRVVCDSTVNTPDIIDANKFRANIFIKPARSINFIELTFIATRTSAEFEELVGQQF